MKNFKILEQFLLCPSCFGDIQFELSFVCKKCNAVYPIIENIPRFIPQSESNAESENSLENKTSAIFGFEWDYFQDWGFISDDSVSEDQKHLYYGGMVSNRKAAFDSKCRLTNTELSEGIILDAGCGNGRYTYEAATRGKALIIGVDIGNGAVNAAYKNCSSLNNVLIIQASLFALPFRDQVIDHCFSNGVLMHTGDAQKSFKEISRTIRSSGQFIVNVYQKLNEHFEWNDKQLRDFSTKLTIEQSLEFAHLMANLAKFVSSIPGGFEKLNNIFRLQSTVHHMFDWYSAPVATHHTYKEVADWFLSCGFEIEDALPNKPELSTGSWACNLKGIKTL